MHAAQQPGLNKPASEATRTVQEAERRSGRTATEDRCEVQHAAAEPALCGRAGAGAGQLVGHYRLIQRLGRGGCASAWLAHHDEFPAHRVVLKLAEAHHDPALAAQTLRREADVLARWRNSGCARLVDADLHGDCPHIVLEWIEGRSLRERISTGPTSARETLELIAELATLLERLHAAGVVHRDIKPDNVMERTQPNADSGRLVLIDFGLSRDVGVVDPTAMQNSLMSNTVSGTAVYMSPEQRCGEATAVADDLYAVGVLLFELATGRQPALHDRPSAAAANDPLAPVLDLLYQDLVAPRPQRITDARRLSARIRELLLRMDLEHAAARGSALQHASGVEPAYRDTVTPVGQRLATVGALLSVALLILIARGVVFARMLLLVSFAMIGGLSLRKREAIATCPRCGHQTVWASEADVVVRCACGQLLKVAESQPSS